MRSKKDKMKKTEAGSRSKKKGSIILLVAGGALALLGFSALAVDVAYLHLTRTQIEAMTTAASKAGYEKLRQLNFDYKNNKAEVDATIRNYLKANGATDAEVAAATIKVERKGNISVTMNRNSKVFFWRSQGVTSKFVAGKGQRTKNNLGPYAIHSTYQDSDQDGRPNWEPSNEQILTSPTPWAYQAEKPYIIKFGRDSGQPGDNADWVFIPMDDDAHTIDVQGQAFTVPAQTVGSNSTSLKHTSRYLQTSKSGRASLSKTNIGLIRAYGIAYDCAGTASREIYWVLGYAGGSFLIKRETLEEAGYTLGTESPNADGSHRAYIYDAQGNTNVKALSLQSHTGDPDYRPIDLQFVLKINALALANKIRLLKIPSQPKIATFTEGNDPVTATMMNAGIPFTAFYLAGDTTNFHSFSINPKPGGTESKADILAKLRGVGHGGPYVWLHLHHEDFGKRYKNKDYGMTAFADAISDFVRVEHGFMFAACWATETLEIALSRLSSPNWTKDGGIPSDHQDHYNLSSSEKVGREIKYDKTFAFQDFFVSESGNRQGNIHSGGTSEGCSGSCFKNDSEIDTEYGDLDVMYTDYLNPMLQNHVGFGGVELREETDSIGTYNQYDYVRSRSGQTDSFRRMGSPELHCQVNEYEYSNIWEKGYYTDKKNGKQQWVREDKINGGCDINQDTIINMVEVRRLDDFKCNCGTNQSKSYKHAERYYFSGDYQYRPRRLDCDGSRSETFVDALATEADMFDFSTSTSCSPDHNHQVIRPYLVPSGGATVPNEIDPDNEVFILSQTKSSTPTSTADDRVIKYISGIGDDDNDNTTGFGRWSYLGGHSPGHSSARGQYDAPDIHSSSSHRKIGLEGMRTYLNNILFGSTAGLQPGGFFTPSTGAVNPAGLSLGTGAGAFGASDSTQNNFQSTFQAGSDGIGLPVGAQFATAPGNFSAGVSAGKQMFFQDANGASTSITWDQFKVLPAKDKANHPQLATIAIVERIPVPATIPTPEDKLDDYLPAGFPEANPDRPLSIYAGDPALPEDDDVQSRDVHVVGFAEFFLVDAANQSPQTTDHSVPEHFVTTKWRDGEVRGYFLRYIVPPKTEVIYPTSPASDPR